MSTSAWAKPIAAAFKLGFPFWFEGVFHHRLLGSLNQAGNP
jgi:hypothetical protein